MPNSPSLLTFTLLSLSIAPLLLSNLFPWSFYDSGFWLFIFIRVLPISFPVSFRFCYAYFISFMLLFVSWYSFNCPYLFLRNTYVGIQFGRFLRAGLSSNGSSEPLSDSLSKLSSHQIPHLLVNRLMSSFATGGTTTAKGLYGNSYFEFNHYAFGGVSATSALCALALHFGFGAEQACSAAARVTSSLPISGLPFVLS